MAEEKTPPEQKEVSNQIIIQDNSLINYPNAHQIAEYESFLDNYNSFVDRQLKEGVDYGIIPGVDKPSLLKPGAEKLEKLFFYRSETIEKEKTIAPDYSFVKYTFTTKVYNKNSQVVATCDGTCNSKEKKYRGYQKFGNEATEEEKKNGRLETRTSKKTGKDYTVYIIDKKDFYDIENTISKMAQKRSYVGAMLLATNSSGRFTQDVEDMDIEAPVKQNPAPTMAHGQNVANTSKPISQAQAWKIKSLRTQKGQDQISDENLRKLTSLAASDEIKRLMDLDEIPTITIDQ